MTLFVYYPVLKLAYNYCLLCTKMPKSPIKILFTASESSEARFLNLQGNSTVRCYSPCVQSSVPTSLINQVPISDRGAER